MHPRHLSTNATAPSLDMRPIYHTPNLLAAILLTGGLAACGGGSHSSSSNTASSSSSSVVTTTSSPPVAVAKPLGSARRSPPSPDSAAGRSSGGAASFRVPNGDNSVPDYGREARASERKRAATALAAFLQASANSEWSRACSYLTSPTRDQLETFAKNSKGKTKNCGPILAALLAGPTATRENTLTTSIAALRINGNAAFALLHGPNASKYVMPMQNENGAWKMSQITPVPYPLGTHNATP